MLQHQAICRTECSPRTYGGMPEKMRDTTGRDLLAPYLRGHNGTENGVFRAHPSSSPRTAGDVPVIRAENRHPIVLKNPHRGHKYEL